MKYTYFARDYFENSGEFDFSKEHYEALIKHCFTYASCFSFVVSNPSMLLLLKIEKWKISAPDYPYQNESHPGQRQFFLSCNETMCFFLSQANSIFDFYYTDDHPYPEDPVFYRSNGSILLDSVVHEGECSLFPQPQEDISNVLGHGHWLEMSGGSIIEEGVPRAPAKYHQLRLSPAWNVLSEPLYQQLRLIQGSTHHLSQFHTVQELESYIVEYCDSILSKNSFPKPPFPYLPAWYTAFRLYVLGECNAYTNDSLFEALVGDGYYGNESVKRFFELLDQYVLKCCNLQE